VIKKTGSSKKDRKLSREAELLIDTIRKVFVLKATRIAETEKAEDMLKMILRSDNGESSDSSQKELWQLLEKVRKDVLGEPSPRNVSGSAKRKASGRSKRKNSRG
jgi:hypothetical protein